jgi:hypothetical protein
MKLVSQVDTPLMHLNRFVVKFQEMVNFFSCYLICLKPETKECIFEYERCVKNKLPGQFAKVFDAALKGSTNWPKRWSTQRYCRLRCNEEAISSLIDAVWNAECGTPRDRGRLLFGVKNIGKTSLIRTAAIVVGVLSKRLFSVYYTCSSDLQLPSRIIWAAARELGINLPENIWYSLFLPLVTI